MKVAIITGARGVTLEADTMALLRAAIGWAGFVILGDCPTGVDAAALKEVVYGDVPHTVCVADWGKYGGRAGPIRNGEMIVRALDRCLGRAEVRCFAFPSKSSRGTWDCLKQAATAGMRGHVYPV